MQSSFKVERSKHNLMCIYRDLTYVSRMHYRSHESHTPIVPTCCYRMYSIKCFSPFSGYSCLMFLKVFLFNPGFLNVQFSHSQCHTDRFTLTCPFNSVRSSHLFEQQIYYLAHFSCAPVLCVQAIDFQLNLSEDSTQYRARGTKREVKPQQSGKYNYVQHRVNARKASAGCDASVGCGPNIHANLY